MRLPTTFPPEDEHDCPHRFPLSGAGCCQTCGEKVPACPCGFPRDVLRDPLLTAQMMPPVTAYALRVPVNDPTSFLLKPCDLRACRGCSSLYAVTK